jgi:dynein heavy chain
VEIRITNDACRYPVPDENFDLARKAYEWPRRFADVLREAGSKAAAEHREFEGALKKRRVELAARIEEYTKEVAVIEGRGEVIRREHIVAEVRIATAMVTTY